MQMSKINWKLEAQKQAADAGTLKMNLALRLDDINTRIRSLDEALIFADDNASINLLNRISVLKEERVWLVSVLYEKRCVADG